MENTDKKTSGSPDTVDKKIRIRLKKPTYREIRKMCIVANMFIAGIMLIFAFMSSLLFCMVYYTETGRMTTGLANGLMFYFRLIGTFLGLTIIWLLADIFIYLEEKQKWQRKQG